MPISDALDLHADASGACSARLVQAAGLSGSPRRRIRGTMPSTAGIRRGPDTRATESPRDAAGAYGRAGRASSTRRWPAIRRGLRIQCSLAPGRFAGYPLSRAGVAESVDAPDLGSGAARRRGSSPFTRTKTMTVPVFRRAVRKASRPRTGWRGRRFERPSVRHGLQTSDEGGRRARAGPELAVPDP